MKNKKTMIGLSVLAIAASALILSKGVIAYQGDYTKKGPDCTSEKHESMEKAFENNDYKAWKELMAGKGRVTTVINEDNFSRFAKAHQLAENGKYDEADKIRKELGLRTKNGEKVGAGYGQGGGQGMGQKNHN